MLLLKLKRQQLKVQQLRAQQLKEQQLKVLVHVPKSKLQAKENQQAKEQLEKHHLPLNPLPNKYVKEVRLDLLRVKQSGDHHLPKLLVHYQLMVFHVLRNKQLLLVHVHPLLQRKEHYLKELL